MTDLRSSMHCACRCGCLIVAAFGVAWNLFGLVQLTDFVLADQGEPDDEGYEPRPPPTSITGYRCG